MSDQPDQVDALDDPIIELFMLAVMSTMREPTLPEFRAKLSALLVDARIDELAWADGLTNDVALRANIVYRIKELEKQREANNG